MAFALTARPSPGNINTPFGPRPRPTASSPATHYGQDYGWGNGTTIYAAADGIVREGAGSGQAGAYGNRTRIEHPDGFETWYCHQSERYVKPGDRVSAGQAIGVQGATGNVVGVHLHFELRHLGVAVNPAFYFRPTATRPAVAPSAAPASDPEETDLLITIPLDAADGGDQPLHMVLRDLFYRGRGAEAAAKIAATTLPGTIPLNPSEGGDQPSYMVLRDVFYRSREAAAASAHVAALSAAVSALAVAQGVDPEALASLIASKVDAALEDNFAAVAGEVADEQSRRLAA